MFEANERALKVSEFLSLTSRTKYFTLESHYFRSCVEYGHVNLKPIATKEQLADVLTKTVG